jgi:hypothetical protein
MCSIMLYGHYNVPNYVVLPLIRTYVHELVVPPGNFKFEYYIHVLIIIIHLGYLGTRNL